MYQSVATSWQLTGLPAGPLGPEIPWGPACPCAEKEEEEGWGRERKRRDERERKRKEQD